jgi:hypothetical protein
MTQVAHPTMFQDQLVPHAHQLDTDEEEARFQGETIWENPTKDDIVLTLHIGANLGRPRNSIQQRGVQIFTIRAGERRSIRSEFDMAIQDIRCQHIDCSLRPRYCRKSDHPHVIVGGLGPRLINCGKQSRPIMAASLDDQRAVREKAEFDLRELTLQKASLEAELQRLRNEAEMHRLDVATAPSTSATSAEKKKG